MRSQLPSCFIFSKDVKNRDGLSPGTLALESAVITHGLPKPLNFEVACEMENLSRDVGAIPATIAIIEGNIHIGLSLDELLYLATLSNPLKISKRDIGTALFQKLSGGTTVAGTLYIAHQAGIRVFATGGIGGVHEPGSMDISADLQVLSETPMIVVCSGGKSILNLPSTLEYLETMSIPVIGYQTDEFPSFYSRESGLPVSIRLDTPEEIVDYSRIHWKVGAESSILVCQPISPENEIPKLEMDKIISESKHEAEKKGITGQLLTPFLLSNISDLTGGNSLIANRALLLNNARLGSEITTKM